MELPCVRVAKLIPQRPFDVEVAVSISGDPDVNPPLQGIEVDFASSEPTSP